MGFDERRRLVTSVLFFVTALFLTGVGSFVQGFGDRVPEPDPRVSAAAVSVPTGPRYTATPADLARRPAAVGPDTPLVALTFDDGPSPERTPWVLDVLRAKGVPATFFLLGEHVQRHPDITRRIRDEGHVIANHSWDHAYFPEIAPQEATEQVQRTDRVITEVTGRKPTLFRYPHGEASPGGDAALAAAGLVGNVGWHWESNLAGDFQCPGPDEMTRFVTTEAIDQALILLHDANDVLACAPGQWEYLPRAIDALRERGVEFGVVVPADEPSRTNQGSRVAVVPAGAAPAPGPVAVAPAPPTSTVRQAAR